MSYRFSNHHHHFNGSRFLDHLFDHNSQLGHFLENLFCHLNDLPPPEPPPTTDPAVPSIVDLSSLDALIGTAVDSVDDATIQTTTGDDYTTLMYTQGYLVPLADIGGTITGFQFTAPDGIALDVTGTIGSDVITTDTGDNIVNARAGNDTVNTGLGNDTLHGGDGNDTLYGGDGNDMLYGDNGSDALYGDAGNDTLNGGQGVDSLYGGSGADTFMFSATDIGTGTDSIHDFNVAEGDKIDLSDVLTAYNPVTDAITDFVQITDAGSNSLVSVDVNGGGDSFQTVAVIQNVTGLTDEQALVTNGTLVA